MILGSFGRSRLITSAGNPWAVMRPARLGLTGRLGEPWLLGICGVALIPYPSST